ncbi:membrane protein required for colicin V production [Hasllibacter halocynthiae]|uniref:Membrane protein required for colicin V production n=1 Tax=Hasllibacter halocynthiae TaxID=595589 RepID=A0A2T0X8S8_9RHOB|nr:CvpA family protein [Hasllibacter halocynthiae]PRY95329.1 membrane protein required for colicin V production [Hasllibacter halocynthiae]
MEGFTWIDGVVAAIVVLSALLAYSRGLVRESMAIGGWIVAALLAFALAPVAAPLVAETPYLDQFIGDSCELSLIAALAIVFALGLVVVSLFTPLLSSVLHGNAVLGGTDRALGFVFGALRGVLLVAIALIVYERFSPAGIEVVEASRTVSAFEGVTRAIEERLPTETPVWITSRSENLAATCAG